MLSMYFLNAGAALPAATTSLLELVQRAVAQHFALLKQGTELSQKLFAKSLEVKTSSGFADFALEYFAGVQKLATEFG
jgi:hypothetical protein